MCITHLPIVSGIIFTYQQYNIAKMVSFRSTYTSKKLLIRFILDSIDFRKRSVYLQEMIAWGKTDEGWKNILLSYFETASVRFSAVKFCPN